MHGSSEASSGVRARAVAWRAALLVPFLLLARGDVVISHTAGAGIQGQILNAEPWMEVWLTPHVVLHFLLYDDVVLSAIATGLAVLWLLVRQGRRVRERQRAAGGMALGLALLGPGAGCG